jgi:hypothetical protein
MENETQKLKKAWEWMCRKFTVEAVTVAACTAWLVFFLPNLIDSIVAACGVLYMAKK